MVLDRGLALFWPGPSSFTGEDVGELHLHGGVAVVAAVIEALGTLPGFRMAEAGEFTRRAFENGRIDLAEAEGLADLVSAETELQRRSALWRAAGGVSERCEAWRAKIMRARAWMEAEIDFSEEEQFGELSAPAWALVEETAEEIGRELARRDGEIVRDGAEIVITGRPNSGKSTLLNALARREVAIVSPTAGTTRDLIEVRLDLGGIPVTLVDTAGLRETRGAVEAEGVRRARHRASSADLVLVLTDMSRRSRGPVESFGGEVIRIGTMADRLDSEQKRRAQSRVDHLISAASGEGVDGLVTDLSARLAGQASRGESALITRQRHRDILEACRGRLSEALSLRKGPVELAAESLRAASDAIGQVTGRVGIEDVLDGIFSEFCIGK